MRNILEEKMHYNQLYRCSLFIVGMIVVWMKMFSRIFENVTGSTVTLRDDEDEAIENVGDGDDLECEQTVSFCVLPYDEIYKSGDSFKSSRSRKSQLIIIDSGCPRSLMGVKEFEKIKEVFEISGEIDVGEEKFKFGPSRLYESRFKVRIPVYLEHSVIELEFFVVNGDIPILLGNDVMEPLKASIDLGQKKLKLKQVGEEIKIEKTDGGHFVLLAKNFVEHKTPKHSDDDSINVRGSEADAIMTVLFANLEQGDLEKFHDAVSHQVFVEIALEEDEKIQVDKVHRYFGHRSGRRIWELFAKAGKLRGKKEEVLSIISKCKICSKFKKAPARPKVAIPSANDFNDVVGIDLKVVSKDKGLYIVWMVDLFNKLIKGKFVSNKKPSTIIEAIVSSWIMGDGCGPGHPRRGFWTDNGGEFLNEEVIDFAAAQDVDIKMTAAHSPWQNGVVERHHATTDIIVDKLILENPQMSYQEAINQACFAKNSAVGQSRFSPLQLMMGQSPFFPGLSQANPASSNMKSSSKYMKTLKNIDETRVNYRQVECDNKLKKAFSQRINSNVEKYYNLGDPIFFYNDKKKEWKKGTALIRLGKTLYLRYGNFLRRVAIEKVRPDYNGEISREERYVDPTDEEEENEERFTEEESL